MYSMAWHDAWHAMRPGLWLCLIHLYCAQLAECILYSLLFFLFLCHSYLSNSFFFLLLGGGRKAISSTKYMYVYLYFIGHEGTCGLINTQPALLYRTGTF